MHSSVTMKTRHACSWKTRGFVVDQRNRDSTRAHAIEPNMGVLRVSDNSKRTLLVFPNSTIATCVHSTTKPRTFDWLHALPFRCLYVCVSARASDFDYHTAHAGTRCWRNGIAPAIIVTRRKTYVRSRTLDRINCSAEVREWEQTAHCQS